MKSLVSIVSQSCKIFIWRTSWHEECQKECQKDSMRAKN